MIYLSTFRLNFSSILFPINSINIYEKNFFTLFFIVLNLFVVQSGFGQCGSGLDSVSIQAITDEYGYEGYWELVPGTNTCGKRNNFRRRKCHKSDVTEEEINRQHRETDMEICKHILKVHGVYRMEQHTPSILLMTMEMEEQILLCI